MPTETPALSPGIEGEQFQPNLISTQSIKPASTQLLVEQKVPGFIYLQNGRLFHWLAQDKSLVSVFRDDEVNSDEIILFNLNEMQTLLAIVQRKGVTVNGVALYTLSIWRFPEIEFVTRVDEIRLVDDLRFAPYRNRLAWREAPPDGHIYLLDFEKDSGAILIAQPEIQPGSNIGIMSWNSAGDRLIWSDERGIWLSKPEIDQAVAIAGNSTQVSYISGETHTIQVLYNDISFSPDDRFLLARVHALAAQISWWGVVDVKTGRSTIFPDSYSNSQPGSQAIWIAANQLLEAGCDRSGDIWLREWEILPTRADLRYLVTEKRLDIFDLESGDEMLCTGSINTLSLDSRENIVLEIPLQNRQLPMMTRLDPETLVQLDSIEVPYDLNEVAWDPHGRNAILSSTHGATLFYSMSSKSLYDLQPFLGVGVQQPVWIK